MDVAKLQQSIKGGNIPPLCIFTGDEIELQNIYLRMMGEYKRVDTVGSIFSKLSSKLLKGTNDIYVVRDDMDFMKNEKAWTNIESKIKNGTLVLQFTNLDKKTKFYKKFKEDIIEFHHMTTEQLYRHIKNKVDGTERDIKYLIEQCNNDYNTVLNEIDKIQRIDTRVIVTRDLVDSIIKKKDEVNVFSLIDAIMSRKSKLAFKLLNQLLEDNANVMGIFTLLHTRIHQHILVEGYRDSNNISNDTNISAFIVKSILNNSAISPSELLQALRTVEKYQQGIMNGSYESNVAIQCCISEIMY